MSRAKLFLSVSVIAMFAVGSAWATTPAGTEDDTVATSHSADIYPSNLGPITAADGIAVAVSQFKDSGIAGVTYVNRMVGVAGGAAQQAENHAAAAGAYAIAAAKSADEAKDALSDKEDVANKLKTTDTTTITNENKDKLYPSVGKVQSMLPDTSHMGDSLGTAFTNGGGIQQRYKEVASIGQIQELTTTSSMPWVRQDYVNKGLELVPAEDGINAELNVKVAPAAAAGALVFDDDGALKVNTYGGDMSNIPTGPALGDYANMVPRADMTIAALNTRVNVNQGSDNIKKVMAVNVDGKVVPATLGPGLEASGRTDIQLNLLESADGAIGGVRKSTESYVDMLNVHDDVDNNSDGDYVPTTSQLRSLQSEVAGVADKVRWTQDVVTNGVVTTDDNGVVSARSVGDTMVVNNGTLDVIPATASVPGVSVLGVIPSGANKSGTATIWVE
ncbi:MAG: hypothetical protein R8M37_00290 [Alphaproteobacteria bacterium]|nr:hypothetical protein [Alphaproteobacteria bacterium]